MLKMLRVPLATLLFTLPTLAATDTATTETTAAEPALAIDFNAPDLSWGPCPDFIPAGCEIAVLHGDPAAPNADILFKVPASFTVPHHWHTSAERMVLLSGRLQVTYDGQPGVTLTPGMYAYGPPQRPHWARCEAGDPCVLFIAFEGPIDAMPVAAH